MNEIPIRFKLIKYPKKFGKTTGGLFTRATLFINENKLKFEHKNFKILKYLFNQLPLEFEIEKNMPEKFYKNKYGEYKLHYSTSIKNCEITFKLDKDIDYERLNPVLEIWLKKIY